MTQQDLGGRVRASREEKGWTAEQLGLMVELSLDQVAALEANELPPDGELLHQLEVLFGAPPESAAAASKAPPPVGRPAAATRKRSRRKKKGVETADYRHTEEKRKNIPPAKIAGEGTVPVVPKVRYYYNPHLPPVLRFDPTGEADRLDSIIRDAGSRPLRPEEQSYICEAVSHYDPWLEWAGKREQHEQLFFEVDPVALHIHERISAQAIVRAAMRQDPQRNLFADPEQPYSEAIQFYRHDVDWANRLILGDSLQVMSSLARREGLAGKVQMIYVDPPYGIKFSSNFQPQVGRREVKEQSVDLTREPEMVRAYRDAWVLGRHSYLSYLRARLLVARELLASTGSIFVQMNDENLNQVRSLLDEIFGGANFVSLVSYVTTSGFPSNRLSRAGDYLIWYARDMTSMKYNRMFESKRAGDESAAEYKWALARDGSIRKLAEGEFSGATPLPEGARAFRYGPLTSSGSSEEGSAPYVFRGKVYSPGRNNHWKVTSEGLNRLGRSDVLLPRGRSLAYFYSWIIIP